MNILWVEPAPVNAWTPKWREVLEARGHTMEVHAGDARDPRDVLARARRLRRRAREAHADVVWAHFATTSGFLAALARPRAPVVLTLWGSDVLQATTLSRRVRVRAALSASDIVTTSDARTSDFEAALRDLGNRREVLWAQWGSDLRTFRPEAAERARGRAREALGASDDEIIVGSIRHARPLYDVVTLQRGFAEWSRKSGTPARLVVLGGAADARYLQILRDEARALGIVERVTFVEGFLEPARMLEHYAAIDAPVSLAGSDRLGAPIVETLALGKVPILNDLPSYRELLDGFELLRVPGRPTAADVARALDAHARLDAASRRGRANAAAARRFDFHRTATQVLDDLEDRLGW